MKNSQLLKTEEQLTFVKEIFAGELSRRLELVKVSSPLVIPDGTGINDDLNGTEQPVAFNIKAQKGQRAVVVHSLAKWKRLRLKEFGIAPGKGILTDMRALRPDEDYTPLHSVYVDQWDWEKHIDHSDRSLQYLEKTVTRIYEALKTTEQLVHEQYPEIPAVLPDAITFIHSEELLQQYPGLSARERETAIARKHGAVFIIGIGGKLSHGEAHDGRAADYDDWSTTNEAGFKGLNGDIILYHPLLQAAFEVSSMGIRVDKTALLYQLDALNCSHRSALHFHRMLLEGELPQSIGGGIGQSRVCMFMLKKSHIGEVQVGIWPEAVRKELAETGVQLL